MHVVLLNQYYPPDVAPTGVMLEAVAEAGLSAQARDFAVVGFLKRVELRLQGCHLEIE